MACDGEIAKEEIALVNNITSKQNIFKDMNIETIINGYIASINQKGLAFLKQYLKELDEQMLSVDEQLKVVDFAVKTIFADNKIEYSEVKFFKKIRNRLSLTDKQILDIHPEIEDFLLPDINETKDIEWNNLVFDNINLGEYKQNNN